MHWTAYLAYRRVPANAQVVGDVGCIHCGYNVRGLRVSANCPECGSRVSDSLIVLAHPTLVAQSLRSFGNSYFSTLILVLGCIGNMTGWPLIVTTAVLTAGAFYRTWSAGELRFKARLGNSEKLDVRIRLLWIASLIELLAAGCWIIGVLLVINVPTLQAAAGTGILQVMAWSWLSAVLVSAAAAGWFELALATILGQGWMIVEIRIQIGAILVSIGTAMLTITFKLATSGPGVGLSMAAGMLALTFLIAVAITWLSLHHVANAAEGGFESWDEMLEGDRVAMVPLRQSELQPETPPISLSSPPSPPVRTTSGSKPPRQPDSNQ